MYAEKIEKLYFDIHDSKDLEAYVLLRDELKSMGFAVTDVGTVSVEFQRRSIPNDLVIDISKMLSKCQKRRKRKMTEKEEKKVQEQLERQFRMGYVKAAVKYGAAPSEIAKELGVSVSTVRSYIKKLG